MIIRVKKTYKDFIEGNPHHPRLTRRDFIERGLLTGAMAVTVPSALIKSAQGAVSCPPPVRNLGGLGMYYKDGGSGPGCYLLNNTMADAAANNATVRANYGITTNLQAIGNPANGGNMVVNIDSAFGKALLLGAPGYTAATWLAVLNKCSLGTTVGPLNRDDGGESDALKVIAGMGKKCAGKDISSGNQTPIAPFVGTPSAAVNNLSVANLAGTYSATPAGQTNAQTMTNSANAALALSSLFGGVFGLTDRKGGVDVVNNAGCGFFADSQAVDPNYGQLIFDPNRNPLLTANLPGLTARELAMLGAFHASANGSMGAVTLDVGGYDYHNQGNVAPKQIEAARALVMFLVACDKAGAKGVFIMASNGSAIGSAPRPQTNQTIGGNSGGVTTINCNDNTPEGDSGGFHNQIDCIYFDPNGSPPVAKSIGSINPGTGSATSDPKVTSGLTAFVGAYHGAARWLGTSTMDMAKIEAQFTKLGLDYKSGDHLG